MASVSVNFRQRNHKPKENISKEIIKLQNASFRQQSFIESLAKGTVEYIIEIYDRLLENEAKFCIKANVHEATVSNARLFERAFVWIIVNEYNVKEKVRPDILRIWRNEYKDNEDFAYNLNCLFVNIEVNIFYLAQFLSIFDNIEAASNKGYFPNSNVDNLNIFDHYSYVDRYLRYNRFYSNKTTVKDYIAFCDYFFTYPKQVNSLFFKADIIDIGFDKILLEKDCYGCDEVGIFHKDDEEPDWFEENGPDCFEYRDYESHTDKIIDDYFSFGYVLKSPFNAYELLARSVPNFDYNNEIKTWLQTEFQKKFGYDYYVNRKNKIQDMDNALKGNSFYEALTKSKGLKSNGNDFFSKGILKIHFQRDTIDDCPF